MSSGIRYQVLDMIRRQGRTSATELAQDLGLHKSTISQNLKDLLQAGLVREAGAADPGRRVGKPRLLLELDPDRCHVLGIDAGPTHLKGGIYDFQGNQVYFQAVKYSNLRDQETFLKELYEFLDGVVEKARETPGTCLGMGVGFSGVIDSRTGYIRQSESSGIKDYPLAEALTARYHFPVKAMNDANAALLGEKWFVLDKLGIDAPSILYCFMDSNFVSVGFGLMIEGKIYEGAGYQAGEVYTYMYDLHVYDEIHRLVAPFGVDIPPFEDHFQEYFSPRAVALGIDKVVLDRLFEIYANLLIFVGQFFNPGLLIMGGNFAIEKDLFLNPFLRYFQERFRERCPGQTLYQVRSSGLDFDPVSAGATVPFFQEFLAEV